MLFALRLLAITVPSGWIVLLGGAERVQGLCALLEFDLATLFTEPLTVQHVRCARRSPGASRGWSSG